jgi:hypothetical protein
MEDKYVSQLSYYSSILAIGLIVVSIILSSFKFLEEYSETSIGIFILIGPFLGLILLVSGITGYRRNVEIKKAKIGIITGLIIMVITICLYLNLMFWLDNFRGIYPQ